MKERTASEIAIKRGKDKIIALVPITARSKRTYKLMSEDSITLSFTTEEAIFFEVGDWCDDELFGRFVVRERQMPKYNESQNSYEYDLVLVAEYMMLANFKAMFVQGDLLGNPFRKESEWYLTDNLTTHLAEIKKNCDLVGYTDYDFKILESVKEADNVKNIAYTNIDIIAALNLLAQQWECEWFINPENDREIRFGKCEIEGTTQYFKVGNNVEKMSASNSLTDHANKLYVYGGKENIPPTYRKQLWANIISKTGDTYQIDKEISADEFGNNALTYEVTFGDKVNYSVFSGNPKTELDPIRSPYYDIERWWSKTDTSMAYIVKGLETISVPNNDADFSLRSNNAKVVVPLGAVRFNNPMLTYLRENDINCEVSATLSYGSVNSTKKKVANVTKVSNTTFKLLPVAVEFDFLNDIPKSDKFSNLVIMNVDVTVKLTFNNQDIDYITGLRTSNTSSIAVTNDGITYTSKGGGVPGVTTISYNDDDEVKSAVVEFSGDKGNFTLLPGYTLPSSYPIRIEIDDTGSTDIPSAYYVTDINNPTSLTRLGDRRLQLPVEYDGQEYDGSVYTSTQVYELLYTGEVLNTTGLKEGSAIPTSYDKGSVQSTTKIKIDREDSNGTAFIRLDATIEYNKLSSTTWVAKRNPWIFTQETENGEIVLDFCSLEYHQEDYNASDGVLIRIPKDADYLYLTYNDKIAPSATIKYVPMQAAIKEGVIAFDNIYPQPKLYITDITEHYIVDKEEWQGEDIPIKYDNKFYRCKIMSDETQELLLFKDKWALDTLRMRFLSAYEAKKNGYSIDYTDDTHRGTNCKLGGMTFEVNAQHKVAGEYDTYEIIRNQDFGTMLPSEVLAPHENDPIVLLGWNVRALGVNGIIEAAENRLMQRAQEYAMELENGVWTFDCTMMCDYGFIGGQKYGDYLLDSNGDYLLDSEGNQLIVKAGDDFYALPLHGTKVQIEHGALRAPKMSRVIGYEFQLDKPYDAPRYTVGETEAYSRLKQIEKELTKLG